MTQTIKPQASDADLALKGLRAFKQTRGENNTVTLPKLEANSAIGQAIQEVFEHFARGEAVQVSSADRELTTQEAADWLQVSRPHLVKMLEQGLIPFYKVGNQRRVRFFDLKSFHKMQREAALVELSQLQQELGLYDVLSGAPAELKLIRNKTPVQPNRLG